MSGQSGQSGAPEPVRPDLVLDCRGKRCPLPVIELARRIEEVATGRVVAVVADDPAAAADIPSWCRLRGHDYLGAGEAGDGMPSFLVRRR